MVADPISPGSLYANPHAPTSVNSITQTYDKNGNLATTSSGLTNTWSYNNRLTQSTQGSTTLTYLYDQTGQRVQKTNATSTTYYPFTIYEQTGATSTKHIYAGDTLLASIDKNGTTTHTYHNHLDHLGSINAVTTNTGSLDQLLAYYPYGGPRISTQYGNYNQPNKYIGQDYDTENNLSYLNARYYNPGQGVFISEDPVFLSISTSKLADLLKTPPSGNPEERSRQALNSFLRDPQLGNSYSYARNNPLTLKDPEGNSAALAGQLFNMGLTFEALGAALDSTIAGAPAGIIVGGVGIVVVGTGGLVYYLSRDSGDSVTSGQSKGDPKSPKIFWPTPAPQARPADADLPPGHTTRAGEPTADYPDGYWRQFNEKGEAVEPSTGKMPSNSKSPAETRGRTHVPNPPKSSQAL